MSCEQDMAAVQDQIRMQRVMLSNATGELEQVQRTVNALQATLSTTRAKAATATGSTGPAARPATQPQEERRGAGDGEMAQYAALMRDIADMEGRLDKIEVK